MADVDVQGRARGGVEAVIFDWGGTLTRWHDVDFHAESLALAQAVVNSEHEHHVHAQRLHAAGDTVWGRSRDHQQSSTIADLFDVAVAGLAAQPGVSSVISGATRAEQVRTNAAALRWEPTDDDLDELEEI